MSTFRGRDCKEVLDFPTGFFEYVFLMSNHIEAFPLTEIHETDAPLRLTNSRAQTAMDRSLAVHGQVSPVVCVRRPRGLELVDGFKRLRSARLLLWPSLQVRLLERSECATKAEMIWLNRVSRSISPIEEARILHSLHFDDRLSRAQIAALLNSSVCWVNRRLLLMENLHAAVLRSLEQGLISAEMARLLAKASQPIQEEVLALVLEERLGSRELGKLIPYLCAHPRANASVILANYWEITLSAEPGPAPSRKAWFRRLAELNDAQHRLLAGAVEEVFAHDISEEMLLRDAFHTGQKLLHDLDLKLPDKEPF